MKQRTALDKILKSLISTIEEEYQTNEATLKNNFFYHLRLNNPLYQITVEENLNNHIKLNGRADFFLNDTSKKSYRDDIVIEFKINCTSKNLINHDIKKLEKIKTLNPHIACLFINVFTNTIDFLKYLSVIELFEKTKVYTLTISKSVNNFFIDDNLETKRFALEKTTIISSTDRFLSLTPKNIATIKIPCFQGQNKFINLYPKSQSNSAYGKSWNKNKNDEKPYFRFVNPIKKTKKTKE